MPITAWLRVSRYCGSGVGVGLGVLLLLLEDDEVLECEVVVGEELLCVECEVVVGVWDVVECLVGVGVELW